MARYELTLAAEADLREIARCTLKQWGEQQAKQYAGALIKTCQSIANGTAVSRTVSEQLPDVPVTRCEQHYVFYLRVDGQASIILAILHKRMNMLARLAQRLSD